MNVKMMSTRNVRDESMHPRFCTRLIEKDTSFEYSSSCTGIQSCDLMVTWSRRMKRSVGNSDDICVQKSWKFGNLSKAIWCNKHATLVVKEITGSIKWNMLWLIHKAKKVWLDHRPQCNNRRTGEIQPLVKLRQSGYYLKCTMTSSEKMFVVWSQNAIGCTAVISRV